MPDLFIPLDTSGISPYLTRVSNRNFIYRFAFEFVDKHRNETRSLKDFNSVDKYLEKFNLLEDFIAYAAKSGVTGSKQQIKHSQKILEVQLKASIARNLIDDDGFYPYIKEIDNTLLKAIDYMESNKSISSISGLFVKPDPKSWYFAHKKISLTKDIIAFNA
jgi:carboxyl-terminal processing protease